MAKNGIIKLHYEGNIVTDHRVTARTLGKTLIHLQNALDRAYLETKYGNLWKHARMRGEDYLTADFTALYPEEGGFIQKLTSTSDVGKKLVDRISRAMKPAVEKLMQEGEEEATSISQQLETRKVQVAKGIVEPKGFEEIFDKPDKKMIRSYGDRSINREIDQVLSIIRSPHAGESTMELSVVGEKSANYNFNKYTSEKFHKIVSKREIGSPVLYVVQVRVLDRERLNGKVKNLVNDKTSLLHFSSEEDFIKAHPYLANKKEMVFIGAPLIEYGAFDPNAGDIYFLDLVK